ncbi:MAG: hypothetical protein JWQ19_160 [Subtercola sp.]|nr:hypothetical protein [Subtercola sp.]
MVDGGPSSNWCRLVRQLCSHQPRSGSSPSRGGRVPRSSGVRCGVTVGAAGPRPFMSQARRLAAMHRIDPLLRAWLESIETAPVFVRSHNFEVVASNQLARELTAAFDVGTNLLRATFFDPAAREWLPEWADATGQVVALVLDEARVAAPRAELQRLVGELASKSDQFAQALAEGPVALTPGMPMELDHPRWGRLRLSFQQLRLPGSERQTLVLVNVSGGSSSK